MDLQLGCGNFRGAPSPIYGCRIRSMTAVYRLLPGDWCGGQKPVDWRMDNGSGTCGTIQKSWRTKSAVMTSA